MTQEVLAEKTNLSVSFISRLETGYSMTSIEKLYDIASVLNVGLQDLLCDFLVIPSKNASEVEELQQIITQMDTHEIHHLLEYAKLFKKFTDEV